MSRPFRREVQLDIIASGAGTFRGTAVLFPRGTKARIDYFAVRRDAADTGGGASGKLYLLTGSAAFAATPPAVDDTLVAVDPAIALTQSATVASIQSGLDYPPHFEDGCRVAAEVVFAGAGTSMTHWIVSGEIG